MRNTKIDIIVSFIMSGLILIIIYCLNCRYTFVEGGRSKLIAGILCIIFSVGILVLNYIKAHKGKK